MEGYHKTVFGKEAIDALGVGNDWYLDCTLGDGGHSVEIIKRGGRVIGIDVDPQAIERARKRFEQLGISKDKYKLIQGNFRDCKNLIQPVLTTKRGEQTDKADQKFAGAIFDLGVSSLQLLSPERGFSFGKDGPLDMRMDPTLAIKALDLVNNLSRKELYEIFTNLGEEKCSKRLVDSLVLAREIIAKRNNVGISSTTELAGIIERALGGKREKIHPATRVFQALRIMVNDELGALEEGLPEVIGLLEEKGLIVVISFHSLEDRIVKITFRKWEDEGMGTVLTKRPIIPSEEEVIKNPRARSAKLRIFRKV